jgi:3-oxosteroid 1-dehydrogenase
MSKAKIPQNWDRETDILIAGTGGAGLTAAIVAHDQNADVMILEKSDKVGGTTAVSGGVVWIPIHHHMKEAGVTDSREEALKYLKKLAEGRIEDSVLESLVDNGPEMLKFIEENTKIRFKVVKNYPENHPEWEGAKPQGGRMLESGLFDKNLLGEWKNNLRVSPLFSFTPVTFEEALKWKMFSNPSGLDMELLTERLQKGITGFGESTMGHLLLACLERDIKPMLNTTATRLILDDTNQVVGVIAIHEGKEINIRVNKGVILATGGYEWDQKLVKDTMPGAEPAEPTSPPHNEGETMRMVMEAGAALANMGHALMYPGIRIPEEEYDGKPFMRLCFGERALPHSIIVNRAGKRFINESHSYTDIMKQFNEFDPITGEYSNVPAWAIVSSEYMKKYMLVTTMPGDEPPAWIKRGNTLEELAKNIGVDPIGLKETVARFNKFAETGKDLDFHRGESVVDNFSGDADHKPNPNLGKLEKGPFYAVQVHKSIMGTTGGPKIDANGRVLDVHNKPIEGLYAAGNAAMGLNGPGYASSGSSIGSGMTFGWLAARDAAKRIITQKSLAHA